MSGSEEQRMRSAACAWARQRWPGVRVLHELVLGERRIDLVFVGERDVIGMEIKSSVDTLDRLLPQVTEYSRYFPEIWVGAAPKWRDHKSFKDLYGINRVIIGDDAPPEVVWPTGRFKPHRDELVCSRMLELLWYAEACAIAVRTDVIPHRVPKQMRRPHVLKMLARLLTGNEIIAEVCKELRARSRACAADDDVVSLRDNVSREAADRSRASPATAAG